MKRPVTFAVCGFGIRGMEAYSSYQKTHPDEMSIAAVADPDPARRAIAQKEYGVPAARCYETAEALLQQPRLADVLIVATQDRQHVEQAIPAMEKGYHLVLEKPISPSLRECIALREKAHETNRAVIVCHVLRYTQFYGTVKQLLAEGAIGRIEAIEAAENVAYWHYAHSYVRGNWRRTDAASPMILAKSCHDMDILRWLVGAPCKRVSSYGGLDWFKPENAPRGAAKRCLDGCKAKDGCPYDADKIYLHNEKSGYGCGNREWPLTALCADPTPEKLYQALRTGAYGRCVYHCDNDVVDHQVVAMEFENGIAATLTMTAFTPRLTRTVRVMGTKGMIEGDLEQCTVTLQPFGGEAQTFSAEVLGANAYGHGGGDVGLMHDFVLQVRGGGEGRTSAKQSLESHLMAFAAEQARVSGAAVELAAFERSL